MTMSSEARSFTVSPVVRVWVAPDHTGPLLELVVVSDAALKSDGLVVRIVRWTSSRSRIATLAVLDDLGGALECTHLRDSSDVLAVPHDLELEVLVRVDSICVYGKFSHGLLSSSTSHLLQVKDDELSRLERCVAHDNVDDAGVDVVFGCGRTVTEHEERVCGP